jgi:hypothetical protein
MTTGTTRGLTLAELSDEERNERFDRLQERMRGVWEIMRRNEEGESLVVIPSVSVDRVGERSGSLQQAYEERDLAIALGIPMYAADPRFFPLGTKSGCRELFADLGVRHPLGFENLCSIDEVTDALIRLRAARPGVTEALVKLNEGVSGEGNALVDLHNLAAPGSPGEREEIALRVQEMAFELPGTSFSSYAAKLAERGGIVEERITGVELRSPSVQLRATPFGEVELLSTHDQLLGGPSGQSYLGCTFPADFAYAKEISADAQRIGERLAREGVLGRFAIDFVVVRWGDGSWTSYAIELNLRKGGTTHPFLTLQFLTDGRYDPATALFLTPKQPGEAPRCDRSSRIAHAPRTSRRRPIRHRGATRAAFRPGQTAGRRVPYDQLPDGARRVGLTAVGDTPASAKAMYHKAERIFLEEARESLADRPLLG